MPSESITSTTAAAGCTGCTWMWSSGEAGVADHWVFLVSDCVNAGCFCPDAPTTSGTYQGEQITLPCQAFPTTTTSSTSSTTTTSSSSSTTTSSTSSTSTSSTSSTTTTTTTTAAPCTGGCTWRWSAAGSTWLKYGPGNCSTGCSCQAPTTPGTVDGEYQTVSCGRLTCHACCGSADCCAIPACCASAPIGATTPRTLTATVMDVPTSCIDGFTFNLIYIGNNTSIDVPIVGSKTVTYYWTHSGTNNLLPPTPVTPCAGKGTSYGAPPYDCSGTPNPCSNDVKISMLFFMSIVYDYYGNRDNCTFSATVSLITGGVNTSSVCTDIGAPSSFDQDLTQPCTYPLAQTMNKRLSDGSYSCHPNFNSPSQTLKFEGVGDFSILVTE